MARRGGRRGRRSRSRQNRSRRSTRSTRSRRTTTRRSAPSRRRNTRTTTRASNRRATVSKARRTAPKRTAPKKKAPTARRAAPSNRRATVSKARRASAPKRTAPKKTTPTRTTQQRTNQRGVGARKTSTPKKAVNASVGKPATSKRQATRINRKPPTTFKKAVQKIQNKNLIAGNYTGSYSNRQLMPDGSYGVPKVGDVINTGGKSGKDFKYDGKNWNPVTLAAAGDMTNLGIRNNEATAFKVNPASSYGYPSQSEVDNAALGGGAGFIGRKPTGNPNVMSADGTFNRPGPGGPEPESDYTSYKPGSFYNLSDTNMNPTNFLRSTRNVITAPARMLGINNRLTNKLIPKSNEAIQDARDQRGPRPKLKRRGGSGGVSRIQQQAAATQMQPEIAPTIGQPIEETGAAPTVTGGGAEDLTRIQNQAYNTQLTSSLAGMFGGQGSVGYTPQGSPELSPTLRAGRSRGRRRVRLFGARRRRGGTGDQFSRAGDRIARLTNINV